MNYRYRRLGALERLGAFLLNLRLPERPDASFSFVTGQADLTTLLDKSSGIRVLLARPEMRQTLPDGLDPDTVRYETVAFILMKDLGAAKTELREQAAYDDMLTIADAILSRLFDATENCELLAGLRLTGFEVVPEVSIFGSWFGYSVTMIFE